MSNICDYLQWRGDLEFERDGFNEVDNLIFATLSYLDFSGIVPGETDGGKMTLQDAVREAREKDRLKNVGPFMSLFPAVLETAAKTRRYMNVTLSRYVDEIDKALQTQFSAVVFSMGDRQHYIAFRGTDDNLAGWKEDFLMGFKDVVLAQSRSADYVNSVIPKLRGTVMLGGHSKGGNLAVFAGAHASAKNMKRIAAVYNNDGPGFQAAIIQSEGYGEIQGRIRTYIPKSSVVGMLLEHGDSYSVVSSSEKGIMSHNSVTWEVSGCAFVHVPSISKSSQQLNASLRSWLATLTLEQRAQFVEAMFDIIEASGAETLTDLSKERLGTIDAMIRKLKTLDKSSRQLLRDTVLTFFNIRQRMLLDSIGESLDALRVKKA